MLGTGAWGKVFLVRKRGGTDDGKLYAMKVVKKAEIVHGDTGKQASNLASCICILPLSAFAILQFINLRLNFPHAGGTHLGREARVRVSEKMPLSGHFTLRLSNR